MPSPLKSLTPTTDHVGVETLPTKVALGFMICVPFISQIATLPDVSRQRMSLKPSPLKSPIPIIVQVAVGTLPTKVALGFDTWVPFISQIATLPLLSCQRRSLLPSPLKSWVLARHKVLAR